MNCSIAEMGFPANGPPYVIPLDQVQKLCVYHLFVRKHVPVGETGYGCHTFYITDDFRNIVGETGAG